MAVHSDGTGGVAGGGGRGGIGGGHNTNGDGERAEARHAALIYLDSACVLRSA